VEFFTYSDEEVDFLRNADDKLAQVIDIVGPLRMPLDPNLFTSLSRNIIGQQISIPVYERIWADFQKRFGEVPDPSIVLSAGKNALIEMGLTIRKSEYILGIAQGIVDGAIDEESIVSMSDDDAMAALDSIRGIGPWTAEMSLLFYMNRRDVFSFGDLCLIRGLKRMYNLDEVPRSVFEEYRRKFSPYGSVAMLYIWEVGEGRVSLPDHCC